MNAKELMIGDWVTNKYQERIFQVLNVGENHVGEKHCDGMIEGHKEQYLDPVPLTPEILEKNGFTTRDKGRKYMGYMMYFLYDDEDHCLLGVKWYVKENMAEISLQTAPYYVIIKYVHQLQHALRICEINREIVL